MLTATKLYADDTVLSGRCLLAAVWRCGASQARQSGGDGFSVLTMLSEAGAGSEDGASDDSLSEFFFILLLSLVLPFIVSSSTSSPPPFIFYSLFLFRRWRIKACK